MPEYLDLGGILVDPQSGEIQGPFAMGEDCLAVLAHQAMEASEQRKLWEQRERAARAALLRQQPARRAIYGDVTVSLRYPVRRHVDTVRLTDLELSRAELLYCLAAANLPVRALNESPFALAEREDVRACVVEEQLTPFAVCERVRRHAPAPVVVATP